MAEALALKLGLPLAQRTRCNRIIINSDNMEVIDTMKEGGRLSGAAAAVFDDYFYFTATNSTSKISQALGGITPPAPLAP